MNIQKPTDLFLGITDFFGALIPGIVLTFSLLPIITPYFGQYSKPFTNVYIAGIAFIVSAYFLGHMCYLIGSVLDHAYDRIYRTLPWVTRRLGALQQLAAENFPALAEFGDGDHERKWRIIAAIAKTTNDYMARHLDRTRSEARFNRSMVVVLFVMTVILIIVPPQVGDPPKPSWILCVVTAVLTVASLIRYCERRAKLEEEIYEYGIALPYIAQASKDS